MLFFAYYGMVPMTSSVVGGGTGVPVVLGCAFSFLPLYTLNLFAKQKFTIGIMPTGTPMYMAFFIWVIEIVRYCIRPVTLSLRILINLRVGHIFLSFGQTMNGVVFRGFLILYEFCVVLVQIMILNTLITMYKK